MLRYILATEETLQDDTELPEKVIKHLESLIRKGADDLTQKWRDALHLAQTAYKVGQVKRPSPTERSAWQQYEKLIQYAVKELSRTRGLKGDWRLYNEAYKESLNNSNTYEVKLFNNGKKIQYIVEGNAISDIIGQIKTKVKDKNIEVIIKENNKNDDIKLHFYRFNIKQKMYALIKQI